MYNERNEGFSFKTIILQLLFFALFIFIIFWLFPTKNYLDKKIDTLYVDNFSTNLNSMKEAGISYFTTERLPEKEGDTVKITLKQMLELKLLLPFTDKNGNQCDTEGSYIEVTKMASEYVMKVNLKCAGMEQYILVHLGCYDYCLTDVCEKDDETGKTPTTPTKPTKPTNPTNPTNPTDPTTPTTTVYEYEYAKTIQPSSYWSDWSAWTTTAATQTSTLLVEKQVKSESKIESVIVRYDSYIVDEYINNQVIAELKECTAYSTPSATVTTVTSWVTTQEDVLISGVPQDTDSKIYILTSVPTDGYNCNGDCNVIKGYYDVIEKKVTTTTTGTTGGVCIAYKVVPVYGTAHVSYTQTDVVKAPRLVTRDVTYYRTKSLITVAGSTDKQWRTTKTDQTLLNSGYTLTGQSRKK